MTIHELRKRSNEFVANLDLHIADIVDHNEQLLQLNKAQLKSSQTSEGKSLINSRTGSSRYSPAYARKKGYSLPDLYVDGTFYRNMDIYVQEPDQYYITGFSFATRYLVDMYGDTIFGIRDKKKAQDITIPQLAKKYNQLVLK